MGFTAFSPHIAKLFFISIAFTHTPAYVARFGFPAWVKTCFQYRIRLYFRYERHPAT